MSKENKLIDLFKLFFSLCVVAIHTQLLGGVKYGYLLKCNIYRIAVPFFFICSGYYLSIKMINDNYDPKLYVKKFAKLYLFWCILYTIMYNFMQVPTFNLLSFFNDLRNVFYFRSTTIMWYLGVIVLFGILITHIKKKRNLNIIFIISIACYLLGLYFVTYRYLFENTSLKIGIDFLLQYYPHNRYFIFTFMFPLLGFLIGKYNIIKKISMSKSLILLIISQLLLLYETFKYYDKTNIYGEYDYFLMTPLVAFFLFIFLNKIKIKFPFSTKRIRKISTQIFYYHYIFIFTYSFFNRKYHNYLFDLFDAHTSLYFLLILFCTILFIIILNLIMKIILRLKNKKLEFNF